jgi:RNA polymerase sigma factor (sigma-70 family)
MAVDAAARIERLYRARYSTFCRMAAAVTGDIERAHEAVQDGFVRAYASRASYRGEGSLDAWVWRIVLRSALDARAQGGAVADIADAAVALPFPERDPALAAAVQELPPRRRLIVFLRYWADLSVAEIGELLGVAEGTVSATLTQARAALRDALEVEIGETR